jgi:phycobilisome rod-core linker protein
MNLFVGCRVYRQSASRLPYLARFARPFPMALPVLATRPLTNNARVSSFLDANEESPRQSTTAGPQRDRAASDALIEQAYRQIFFHAFKADRDAVLESQLRSGQISTREFIRQLLRSDKFRNDFYRCNSNYRVVEQVVGRVLGRPVHGEQERIAWSIVIAEQGLPAFIDALIDSPEYLESFGEDQVPYQRSRVLAGQAVGTMPFNQQAPRYNAYWRDTMARRAPAGSGSGWSPASGWPRPAWLANQPTPAVQNAWRWFVATGGFVLTGFVIWTAIAMLSTGAQG